MSKMLRVPEEMLKKLDDLSKMTGQSRQKLLEKALKDLERYLFIKKGNEQYAALKKDKNAWAEFIKEREEWDCTLLDGLEDE